eukprot:8683256-Ditylum_brightwellii.AAC.1
MGVKKTNKDNTNMAMLPTQMAQQEHKTKPRTANNKAQHPTTPDTRHQSHHHQQQQPTKHNNQQCKEIPGGEAMPFSTHNLCAGNQQAFWQLSRTPKTAAIAFCYFYS